MKEEEEGRNFSGHYVRQHTHNVRAHALRSDQLTPKLEVIFVACRKANITKWKTV